MLKFDGSFSSPTTVLGDTRLVLLGRRAARKLNVHAGSVPKHSLAGVVGGGVGKHERDALKKGKLLQSTKVLCTCVP